MKNLANKFQQTPTRALLLVDVDKEMFKPSICVCGACLKIVPYTQARHNEEELCSCCGCFCGCEGCHQTAIEQKLWSPKVIASSKPALLIGVDMANTRDRSVFYQTIPENHQSVCNAVNAIMTLAMLNRDVLHINVAYAPHAEDLEVKVFAESTDYMQAHKALFSRCVYLDARSALEQLKTLEDQLIELVADAKDLAIGAC